MKFIFIEDHLEISYSTTTSSLLIRKFLFNGCIITWIKQYGVRDREILWLGRDRKAMIQASEYKHKPLQRTD